MPLQPWVWSQNGSGLPKRARQTRPDVGPCRVDVGRSGRARGRDLANPLVDLVLPPIAHGRRHTLEHPEGGVLDRGRPAALHLGPPLAKVEAAVGRSGHSRAQPRSLVRVELSAAARAPAPRAGALAAENPRAPSAPPRLRVPPARVAVTAAARREEADHIS